MSDKSAIEWTDATWNPVVGCKKISPGCKHCFAIHEVHRMAGNPNPKIRAANEGLTIIEGGHANWTGKVRLIPARLEQPMHRRKPTRYFVNSLSDLFHEDIPDEAIDRIFAVMALCPQHTFQVLTKRGERMLEWAGTEGWGEGTEPKPFSRVGEQQMRLAQAVAMASHSKLNSIATPPETVALMLKWPLPNVWLGVSCEDQQRANERIPLLLQTPAAVRFLSVEPLLEPVSFRWANWHNYKLKPGQSVGHLDGIRGIDWVIVGGESGPGARPMHPDWARSIRDECIAASVPFFFKQWGRWQPLSTTDGHQEAPFGKYVLPSEGNKGFGFIAVGKKAAGRLLDGREWNEMPAAR